MHKVVALWFCTLCFPLLAEPFPLDVAVHGEMILTNLPSAPFPHPERANGHYYHEKFFPADKHYNDSSVAIFIPEGFKAKRSTDFVVHFHGWGNDVTNVFRFYKMAEQLVESRRNAILVVPQGPWHASDSFGGKLEDENGFKRFMADVVSTLRSRGIVSSDKLGNIILSGHSGGYHVMSSIVERGGISEKVKELWLFDALYAETPKYMQWQKQYHGKILNIYTLNGGTKGESETLMQDLQKRHVSFVARNEAEITPKALQKNKLVFIYTDLKHNEVMHAHNTFRDFLTASCLQAMPGTGK